MGKRKNIQKLIEFKAKLSKRIPIQKMILFGSRAKGKPSRYSDFDLIIVSKKFRRVNSLNRSLGFYKYWNLNYPIDFLCYTPEEFKRLSKGITIVREAVKEGIEI